MTNAIARWHSEAKMLSSSLEQVYADKMETALQEMAVQYQEVGNRHGDRWHGVSFRVFQLPKHLWALCPIVMLVSF